VRRVEPGFRPTFRQPAPSMSIWYPEIGRPFLPPPDQRKTIVVPFAFALTLGALGRPNGLTLFELRDQGLQPAALHAWTAKR